MPGGAVERVDRPHVYKWVFATREICFENAGVLTPQTEWIEVRANTPGDLLSSAYRWRFSGGALEK